MTAHWHALTTDAACAELGVNPEQGLPQAEVVKRQQRYGYNQTAPATSRNLWTRTLAQLGQPLILVLMGAGAITALLQEWVDASVILAVVVINAAIGVIQESKAEAALAALARVLAASALVLRDGRQQSLDARELVPGDIVSLAAGDKVPADLRWLYGKGLRTAEAALTGESLPVEKQTAPLSAEAGLAERQNMGYAGTMVVAGRGRGLVVATGQTTVTGHIAELIAQAPTMETPLVKKMTQFSNQLLLAILALGALTFVVGMARGSAAIDMFMAVVALAVGAIPEGLPAAMTVTLAIGVGRMAKRRAIVRHLPAIEALGSTTVICTDKTGTLTENAMTVTELFTAGEVRTVTGQGYAPEGEISVAMSPATASSLSDLLQACALCNDAQLVQDGGMWRIVGDPTEGALLVLAAKGGIDLAALTRDCPRTDELPFDADHQFSATQHVVNGERVVFVKGSPEKLLPACLGESAAEHAAALAMAERGLRVLVLARAKDVALAPAQLPTGLVCLGLVGMIDPPRQRALEAVRACHAAGIRVKMITGDHPATARAIAAQLAIVPAPASVARVLTGRELAELSDEALRQCSREIDVFARVEPEQKLRLVRALQAQGEVVAMTGDGVNDAPALKQADIGVAMGLGGTEVAKESAAMVLTDDNFATLTDAVEAGRGVYDNLIKFITWTIPTNAAEGMVILVAVFWGAQLPITPLQILWINMSTAVLLGMALAFEPVEPGIMRRPPRVPGAPVLDRRLLVRIGLISLLTLGGAFGLFDWVLAQGRSIDEARTVAANVFVLVEVAFLFNCRSLNAPLWSVSPTSNPWIWGGVASMLGLQGLFTYLPAFNQSFATAPIGVADWCAIIAIAVLAGLLVEVEKFVSRPRS